MPGLATRLVVAERVLNQLGQPAQYDGVAVDKAWFMFGALGPAIGDFIPAGPNVTGDQSTTSREPTPYCELWQRILNLAIGPPPSTGSPPTGLIPTLQALQALLAQVQGLVDNQDFDGVNNLRNSGALNNLTTYIQNLTNAVSTFQDINNLQPIGGLIGTGPLINSTQFQAEATGWTGREWLHWKRPGDFATALLSSARASGDPRFISYALGWQVAYATLVCGSDFVNSIVGSCYRTYWWRSRWVSNFVDAWVWGFYKSGATLGDDGNPFPPNASDYASWQSLCNASLHEWIDVTGGALDGLTVAYAVVKNATYVEGTLQSSPNPPTPLINSGGTAGLLPPPLPPEFADFWIKTWQNVYAQDIAAGSGSPQLFTQQGLQIGYLMTWLVLWFQTSGQVIGCLPATSPTPPDPSCDGNQYASQQKSSIPGQGPPSNLQPTPHQQADPGKIVCGAILAIVGIVVSIFTYGAGAGELVGGILVIVQGVKQLNWGELECQLYWVNQFMYNALNLLHQVTLLTGVQHPYAADLDSGSLTSVTFGAESASYMSGAQTCQSTVLRSMLQPWIPWGVDPATLLTSLFTPQPGVGQIASWTEYPPNGVVEMPLPPGVPPWELDRRWPSAFVDDSVRNPATASIVTAPPQYDTGITGTPASFGPAVQSALEIINTPPQALPNWNLDGDRSLGWKTWKLTAPYPIGNSPVQTQSES